MLARGAKRLPKRINDITKVSKQTLETSPSTLTTTLHANMFYVPGVDKFAVLKGHEYIPERCKYRCAISTVIIAEVPERQNRRYMSKCAC